MVDIKISITAILKSMQHACVLRSRLPFGMLRTVSGICSMRGDYTPHLSNQDLTALLVRAEPSCVKVFFVGVIHVRCTRPKGLAPGVSLGENAIRCSCSHSQPLCQRAHEGIGPLGRSPHHGGDHTTSKIINGRVLVRVSSCFASTFLFPTAAGECHQGNVRPAKFIS